MARDTAAQYASWFRALADPTRVQILSLLARSGGPLTVGAITGAVDVGPVSYTHLTLPTIYSV